MKGVSTFLAVIIIIVITLVMGVLITTWTGTFFRTETARTENRTGGCSGVSIGIDDVYFDNSLDTFRVVVRNDGFAIETVNSVSVFSVTGASVTNTTTQSISQGGIYNAYLNASGQVDSCANFSKVVVNGLCSGDVYKAPRKVTGC